MPGAPNRPPENAPEPTPAPPVAISPRQKALFRLVPSRTALLLEAWKGTPSPELVDPLDRAEAAFDRGEFDAAVNALELLSVRFAEPRWPSLPEPFKLLRVPIPAPMPPHWNPDHALAPAEREARRARREADEQLQLAAGSIGWAAPHGVDTAEAARALAEARAILGAEGVVPAFYERMETTWTELRRRLPRPRSAKDRAPAPTPEAEAGEA
ncbi:MAG TPA: hypothetical protein VMG99_04045 [Thermoplasmata archaeon]|jgi:hypothetical protein|nr:hypothetical protein [Thermoplasmata archaeon]